MHALDLGAGHVCASPPHGRKRAARAATACFSPTSGSRRRAQPSRRCPGWTPALAAAQAQAPEASSSSCVPVRALRGLPRASSRRPGMSASPLLQVLQERQHGKFASMVRWTLRGLSSPLTILIRYSCNLDTGRLEESRLGDLDREWS